MLRWWLRSMNTVWDGDWYMRATLDNGDKLGSHECRVGKIFLNAQTWAILNDVADESRAAHCWKSVCERLVFGGGGAVARTGIR